jgi:hypothetical protein
VYSRRSTRHTPHAHATRTRHTPHATRHMSHTPEVGVVCVSGVPSVLRAGSAWARSAGSSLGQWKKNKGPSRKEESRPTAQRRSKQHHSAGHVAALSRSRPLDPRYQRAKSAGCVGACGGGGGGGGGLCRPAFWPGPNTQHEERGARSP